jgi:hypothetical protein
VLEELVREGSIKVVSFDAYDVKYLGAVSDDENAILGVM